MSFAMMFEEGAEMEGTPVRGDHVVFSQAFVDGGTPYIKRGLQRYTETRVMVEKGASGVVEDITLSSVPANDRAKVRIGTWVHSGVPLHILSVIKCALTDDAHKDGDSRSGFDSHDSRDYKSGDSASDDMDVAPPCGGTLNALALPVETHTKAA